MPVQTLSRVLVATTLAVLTTMPIAARAQDVPGDFTEIVADLSPTVVAVATKRPVDMPRSPRDFFPDPFADPRSPQEPQQEGQALGSGFIISEEGHIVTNNHVIQDATEIEILMFDDSSMPAELIGTDPSTDLAVLKIEPPEDIAVAEWGNSDELQPGAWTIAIGSPFGLGGTVTVGVLSARSRDISSGLYEGFLQTDASINRGNSGGPLFNAAGKVIGVNTAIFSPSGANIGIGFAVPSSTAQRVVAELMETGQVERGFIGVSLQPVTDAMARALGLTDAQGAIIAEVEPGSPADTAGLDAGDVVLEVDGEGVEDPRDLAQTIAELDPGTEVTLTLRRNDENVEVAITLAAREAPETEAETSEPGEQDEGRMGVAVTELPELVRRELGLESGQGIMVQRVTPGSPAAEAGVQDGDVILEAGGDLMQAAGDLASAWEDAREQERPILLRIARGDNRIFLAVETAVEEREPEE